MVVVKMSFEERPLKAKGSKINENGLMRERRLIVKPHVMRSLVGC